MIEAVVLDWAGTAVDHGSLAPLGVFVEVFARRNVQVPLAAAREPMGVQKREHIRRMCNDPRVIRPWVAVHGAPPTEADGDALYADAEPVQIACLPDYADPIPGVLDAVAKLRGRGIRIGSTTGYTREMLDVLVRHAAAKGYSPDCDVGSTEVPLGRPAPYLAWTALQRVGATDVRRCLKAGDTVVDIEAGRNAGLWTIGIAATGNLVGLNAADLAALPVADRAARISRARATLKRAGAHYVLDSVAELPAFLPTLERRIARGDSP